MLPLRRLILPLFILCAIAVQADVVVLQSGKEIQGTILVQNEEVVIIKTASGSRFQYPTNEIKAIRKEGSANQGGAGNATSPQERERTNEKHVSPTSVKKVSVAIELAGGAASKPADDKTYGNMSADLLVGSHNLLNRGIFLGGSVGYLGALYTTTQTIVTTTTPIVKKTTTAYSFLPITLAARIPLLRYKYAPMIGIQLGYGVALSKDYQGGLNAGLNIGYCYRISERQRLYIAADCQFQQAFINTTEYIIDNGGQVHNYTHPAGQCFIHYGVRVGIYL
ncbi:MAG: hypothetical protein ACI30J_08560 [Paludibacteraceae bacterium]